MVHMTTEVEAWRGCAAAPYPGCFAKRGWISLIAKKLTFLGVQKRLQEIDRSRVKAGATREVRAVCSREHTER